jgi:hypothetical protein
VEPEELYTLFSDHLGDAELIQWGLSFSTARDAFAGSQSIQAISAYGGSGLLFHLPEVMDSNDYGALTFAVKSDITNLVITPYLETPTGVVNTHLNVADYVHGDITDEWKVAWIPLRDLTGPQTAAIANIYLEFNQPGVVWLDEVKVVEGLEWPLPEFPVGNYTNGDIFGQVWTGNPDLRHTGTDYSSGGAAGKTVVAAHAGKVVSIHLDTTGWKWIVVIQSEGNAFTATYTHLDNLTVDDDGDESDGVTSVVKAGDIIGKTAAISAPHLHFGLRVTPYVAVDEMMTWAGALDPQSFPEAFVDPELIDWQ